MNPLSEKPTYAVLFISEREIAPAPEGYAEADVATMDRVSKLDGFLGFDNARNGKDGIFISYWRDLAAIEEWKNDPIHISAKTDGKKKWYDAYRTVICKIEHFDDFRRSL